MRLKTAVLVALAVCVHWVLPAENIPWAQIPPAALTIAKTFIDKPDVVERKTESNQVVFHVTGSKQDKDAEIEVTSDGKLLSSEQEVPFAEIQPHVQEAIRKLSQNAKLSSITKIFDGQELTYEIEVAKGTQDLSFSLTELGIVLSSEEPIAFEKLSAPVQKTIRGEIGHAKIDQINKVVEDGEISYDIEAKKQNGKVLELSVDMDGDLISMEVAFNQLPKAVQDAVRQKASESKIENISKSTEGADVFYDVETKKGDREIVLSFGDDGLLSSEDEKVALTELPAPLEAVIRSEGPHDSHVTEIWRCNDEDGTAYDVEFSSIWSAPQTIRFVDSDHGYHAQK